MNGKYVVNTLLGVLIKNPQLIVFSLILAWNVFSIRSVTWKNCNVETFRKFEGDYMTLKNKYEKSNEGSKCGSVLIHLLNKLVSTQHFDMYAY